MADISIEPPVKRWVHCPGCGADLLSHEGPTVIFKGYPPIYFGDTSSFAGRCKKCGLPWRYKYDGLTSSSE